MNFALLFHKRSGHLPRALVLAPTCELAKQVENEIKESAPHLNNVCVYGHAFSATMPSWVKKLARKHLDNPLTIDLVYFMCVLWNFKKCTIVFPWAPLAAIWTINIVYQITNFYFGCIMYSFPWRLVSKMRSLQRGSNFMPYQLMQLQSRCNDPTFHSPYILLHTTRKGLNITLGFQT